MAYTVRGGFRAHVNPGRVRAWAEAFGLAIVVPPVRIKRGYRKEVREHTIAAHRGMSGPNWSEMPLHPSYTCLSLFHPLLSRSEATRVLSFAGGRTRSTQSGWCGPLRCASQASCERERVIERIRCLRGSGAMGQWRYGAGQSIAPPSAHNAALPYATIARNRAIGLGACYETRWVE